MLLRKIFLGLSLIVILFFSLPYVISTTWGKSKLQTYLESQLGGKIHIEKLSLRWRGKQSCQDITWQNAFTGTFITADKAEVSASLLDYLQHKNKLLSVYITGTKMHANIKVPFIKKKKAMIIFSPIKATILQKMISFEKTEIYINDSLKIFSNGRIDLEKEQMQITLYFPQKTLCKIFKEAKTLPDSFVLEVPLSTKLNNKALEKALLQFFIKNQGTALCF